MKEKVKFDDALIRTYFRHQVDNSDDSFDEERFLELIDGEFGYSNPSKHIPLSGLAVSLGLLILFSLAILGFPSDNRSFQQSWIINADRNIRTIESMIELERGK